MATTAERLKEIMRLRHLRQVDIVRLAEPLCEEYDLRLSQSDMSQFVSGKVTPGQWKISLLSKVLNVNPAWLMGEDVPMEMPVTVLSATMPKEKLTLTAEETILILTYRKLSKEYQAMVMKLIADNQPQK